MKVVNKPIEELKFADYNPRELTEKQFKDLQESINRFGIVDPIIINVKGERKNVIVGGHQRIKCKVEQKYRSMGLRYTR